MSKAHNWQPEEDEKLIAFWNDGYSAGKIRSLMREAGIVDVSRNSIIGRITRLRIKGKDVKAAGHKPAGGKRKLLAKGEGDYSPADPSFVPSVARIPKPRPVTVMPHDPPKRVAHAHPNPQQLPRTKPQVPSVQTRYQPKGTCQYITGDVKAGNFTYCGQEGFPWCDHHRKIVINTEWRPKLTREQSAGMYRIVKLSRW